MLSIAFPTCIFNWSISNHMAHLTVNGDVTDTGEEQDGDIKSEDEQIERESAGKVKVQPS